MTRQNRNIADVQKWGDVLPEGWAKVRIAKAEEGMSKSSNQPMVNLTHVIQDEPFVGRYVFDNPSLQPHALAKLKAYYEATGQGMYEDGSDDPEALKDGECLILVEHEMYQGKQMAKIPPYGIRSIQDGIPPGGKWMRDAAKGDGHVVDDDIPF